MIPVRFPQCDRWGTPLTKLPLCPQCGEDELGMIHYNLILCYSCGYRLYRERENGNTNRVKKDTVE